MVCRVRRNKEASRCYICHVSEACNQCSQKATGSRLFYSIYEFQIKPLAAMTVWPRCQGHSVKYWLGGVECTGPNVSRGPTSTFSIILLLQYSMALIIGLTICSKICLRHYTLCTKYMNDLFCRRQNFAIFSIF